MASVNEAYAALRQGGTAVPPPVTAPPASPPAPTRPAVIPAPPRELVARRGGGRGCVVVATVVVLLIVAIGIVVAVTAGGSDRGEPTTWGLGSCVEGTDEVTAVRCDGPHDGRITHAVDTADDCPATTDGVVSDRGYIWCIDTDR